MHEQSIGILNEAMADELAAIHQYMYFHFHCDDQGYDPLAAMFKQKAIEEMRHGERIAERILFLKGDVEMKLAAEVQKVREVVEMLRLAKESEQAAVVMYNRFAGECGRNGDSVTKQLFEDLVADEERHYDNFDLQEEHVRKFGEQFLALQTMERTRQFTGGSPEAP